MAKKRKPRNRVRKRKTAVRARSTRTAEPSDGFIAQYRAAAGEGAVVELRMRMLADKIPELEQFAHAQRLEDVENEIVRVFSADVSNAETDVFRRCRQLRNKLLHCDFRAARSKLHELGVPPQRGGVRKIVLGTATGSELVQRLIAGASGKPGTFEYVADTTSTADGGVFGWLLELAASGDLVQASSGFTKASGIVDRLVALADERAVRAGGATRPVNE